MQSETEYFRRVYEATYEDMLRYAVLHFVIGRREYRLCPTGCFINRSPAEHGGV